MAMQRKRQDGFLLPSAFCEQVFKHLQRLYRLLETRSAAQLHTETISKFDWSSLRSWDTCLACIARPPQHAATCEHSLCELCVSIHTSAHPVDTDLYERDHCLLCKENSQFKIRILPETAGQNILCLDGGGVRGIISAMILMSLQEHIGLPIPVQDHFALAYGTSVGKRSTCE